MSKYLLKVGQQAAKRLDVMNQAFGAHSQHFLLNLGLSRGMSVIEVGCGTGNMTTWIAQQVGRKGKVVAIDASAEQIAVAEEKLAQAKIKNVEFICSPIEELVFPKHQFDIAHCRFLLMHLPHPEYALFTLERLVKIGGIISCDETTSDVPYSYPHNPIFDEINELHLQFGKRRALDFQVGYRLLSIMQTLNVDILNPRFVQPIVDLALAKQYYYLGINESKDTLVEEGIFSAAELDDMLARIQAIPESAGGYFAFPRQAQIACVTRKRETQ